ncbi:hypothetical protein JYG23_01985 [Sedimentibacter sp. zth1]|uniref:hypothetical protein n=1 Tax=Sedimentibacter sp. zth1 TaxID=2816908 RepID=UPI001A92D6F7|nr:hypothetical protein [Sedimentibacter sp. zth1]QSX06255.1 hypothetical protein JYG23_01985 [Sedimentibacter sp. zth1]
MICCSYNIAADDTRELVEKHLFDCKICREEVAVLNKHINIKNGKEAYLQEAQTLKAFKKKLRNNKIIISLISALLTIMILLSLFWVFALGTKVNSKDIAVTTEFQQSEDYYLDKEWVIHLEHTNKKALRINNDISTIQIRTLFII